MAHEDITLTNGIYDLRTCMENAKKEQNDLNPFSAEDFDPSTLILSPSSSREFSIEEISEGQELDIDQLMPIISSPPTTAKEKFDYIKSVNPMLSRKEFNQLFDDAIITDKQEIEAIEKSKCNLTNLQSSSMQTFLDTQKRMDEIIEKAKKINGPDKILEQGKAIYKKFSNNVDAAENLQKEKEEQFNARLHNLKTQEKELTKNIDNLREKLQEERLIRAWGFGTRQDEYKVITNIGNEIGAFILDETMDNNIQKRQKAIPFKDTDLDITIKQDNNPLANAVSDLRVVVQEEKQRQNDLNPFSAEDFDSSTLILSEPRSKQYPKEKSFFGYFKEKLSNGVSKWFSSGKSVDKDQVKSNKSLNANLIDEQETVFLNILKNNKNDVTKSYAEKIRAAKEEFSTLNR